MAKLEKDFQAKLIVDLKSAYPDCVIVKNDPNYIQGIPDLLILYNNKWAALECKRNSKAKHRPNQDYYISKMDNMSFARFICPENREEVLDEMEQSFKS